MNVRIAIIIGKTVRVGIPREIRSVDLASSRTPSILVLFYSFPLDSNRIISRLGHEDKPHEAGQTDCQDTLGVHTRAAAIVGDVSVAWKEKPMFYTSLSTINYNQRPHQHSNNRPVESLEPRRGRSTFIRGISLRAIKSVVNRGHPEGMILINRPGPVPCILHSQAYFGCH